MSLIFDIKRYAINDGPGIRITLFFKGCPLSCVWCHNPEGISSKRQKLYTGKKCIGCESCVEVCPQHALTLTPEGIVSNERRCILCGKCTETCPTLALEMSGREYPVEELMRQIERETVVMDDSQGGVTFSGGEPLLHSDFLLQLLQACGEKKIHRAVDTSLYAKPEVVQKVIRHCELFLVDLKMMDDQQHRRYCGVSNEPIHRNLQMIAEAGCNYWIRIPLIENVNADEENIARSADFLSSLRKPPTIINLLPYHEVGISKHEKLQTTYNPKNLSLCAPTAKRQQEYIDVFAARGLHAIIGG